MKKKIYITLIGVIIILTAIINIAGASDYIIENQWRSGGSALRTLQNFSSILWNKTENVRLCANGRPWSCITRIQNPNISIQYHTRVRNLDTGEIIQCGSDVLQGTRIKFEFPARSYQDISWFSTGYSVDSPYGQWTSNAAFSGSRCSDANYVSKDFIRDTFLSYLTKTYIALAVKPPMQNISNTSGLNCFSPDALGSVECTVTGNNSQIIQPQFNFTETYGKFYGFYWNYHIGCVGANVPMKRFTRNYIFNYNQYYPRAPFHLYDDPVYDYTLNVPAQSLVCALSIITPNDRPQPPVINTAPSECIVGESVTLNMYATDPDNDRVSFGVDWLNSNSYTWSEYINSGRAYATNAYTYTTAGTKQVNIFVKDEGGLWSNTSAQVSFECVNPNHEPTIPSISGGLTCSTGDTYHLTIGTSDEDEDRVRVGIDWSNTGLIEWTSFMNQPNTFTVSHAYPDGEGGSKKIQIVAEDERGLRVWQEHIIDCQEQHSPSELIVTASECTIKEDVDIFVVANDIDGDNVKYGIANNADAQIEWFSELSSASVRKSTTRRWDTVGDYSFNIIAEDSTGRSIWSSTKTINCNARPPEGSLQIEPALVRPGTSVEITWGAEHVDSCLLTEDDENINFNSTELSGDSVQVQIENNTTFTLVCQGEDDTIITLTQSASIIPNWDEN